MNLRPYQLEGIERVRETIRGGKRHIVLVLPTGGGKTVVTAELFRSAYEKGKSALFVAHRKELIDQTVAKLRDAGIPQSGIGVIMASDSRRNPVARVQVASVDTLRNRQPPPADLVAFDECHRSLSKSFVDLAEHYSAAVLLGLTATPYRADGRGLGELYDAIVTLVRPRDLIAQGYLVEPRTMTVPKDQLPDLDGVKTSGGDYDETELQAAVDKGALVGSIVEHWQRLADNRRTVVFAVCVEHSRHIVERFRAAGIAAEHLDGETPREAREAILERLRAGATRVVSNCGVLTEGWDCPPVKCCILARPTKSAGLYLQMAGRILRPWESLKALILDHAGNAMVHGLPQDDREFSLAAPKRKGASNACPTRTCPECFQVLPAACGVCDCGHAFETEPREAIREVEGQLVEVDPVVHEREQVRLQVSRAVGRFCREHGFEFSDANKAIWARFRKRRADQSTEDLRAVLEFISNGLLERMPRIAPAVVADPLPELAPVFASDEPIVEASF